MRVVDKANKNVTCKIYTGVPLATKPGISLIILPLMRISKRNLKRTTDTFLFISHTTNVLLFKFRCNIFIGVRNIKEMPGSVASGTPCTLGDHNHLIHCARNLSLKTVMFVEHASLYNLVNRSNLVHKFS